MGRSIVVNFNIQGRFVPLVPVIEPASSGILEWERRLKLSIKLKETF